MGSAKERDTGEPAKQQHCCDLHRRLSSSWGETRSEAKADSARASAPTSPKPRRRGLRCQTCEKTGRCLKGRVFFGGCLLWGCFFERIERSMTVPFSLRVVTLFLWFQKGSKRKTATSAGRRRKNTSKGTHFGGSLSCPKVILPLVHIWSRCQKATGK